MRTCPAEHNVSMMKDQHKETKQHQVTYKLTLLLYLRCTIKNRPLVIFAVMAGFQNANKAPATWSSTLVRLSLREEELNER